MKRILILGANGFIGRNLKERFQNEREIELYCPQKQEVNVLQYEQLKRYLEEKKFDIVLNALDRKIDISNPNKWSIYVEEKIKMYENLFNLNKLYGKMLYFGTGAEYDRSLPITRISEEEFGRSVPNDSYGFTMYSIAQLARGRENVTNFRLFGIWGKYEDYTKRLFSNVICQALLNGKINIHQNAVFDYLHIDELCSLVEYYIYNNMLRREYNAGSSKQYELVNIAQQISAKLGNIPITVKKNGYNREYTSNSELLLSETKNISVDIGQKIDALIEYYIKEIHESRIRGI